MTLIECNMQRYFFVSVTIYPLYYIIATPLEGEASLAQDQNIPVKLLMIHRYFSATLLSMRFFSALKSSSESGPFR